MIVLGCKMCYILNMKLHVSRETGQHEVVMDSAAKLEKASAMYCEHHYSLVSKQSAQSWPASLMHIFSELHLLTA